MIHFLHTNIFNPGFQLKLIQTLKVTKIHDKTFFIVWDGHKNKYFEKKKEIDI